MSIRSRLRKAKIGVYWRPITLAVCLAASGCSVDDSGTAANGNSAVRSDLYLAAGVALWPNHTVPVCYFNDVPNAASLAQSARTDMDTFGWSAVGNIHFTGWGVCNSGGNNGSLNLHFSTTQWWVTVGSPAAGYPGANGQISVTANVTSDQTQFTLPNGALLHEFGHVLGFAHEQDRPDNVPAGSPTGPFPDGGSQSGLFCDYQTDEVGGLYLTSYVDTQSVMSYCSQDALSAGDVAGVQALYGIGGNVAPMRQGQNSSTNAVARTPNNLDTFVARADGTIWINSWSNTPDWPWPDSQVASGGMPNSPIAATARTPSNMDIFFAGADGAIHTAAWQQGSAWGAPFGGVLPGTDSLAQPGEQVAAVASTPGTIDVFFAGNDGNLYWSHWWFIAGWFGNAVPIVTDGSVPAGAAVTAVARTPDRLDVFYVDTNGVPHSAYCYGSSGQTSCYSPVYNHEPVQASNWHSFPIPTSSSSCSALPGTGIAAAARTTDNIDLFYANSTGTMCTNYWGGGTWGTSAAPNSYAFGLRGVASPGALVSVVARTPIKLDAFFVGIDGALHSAWWDSQQPRVQEFEVTGSGLGPGIARVGSPVGVTARTPNNLDVFAAGAQGVTTAYWSAGAPIWAGYSVLEPLWFTSELSVNDQNPGVNSFVTLSVTTNQDVGPTPDYISIFDMTTSQLLSRCGGGTTCTATATSSTAATHRFRAYISGNPSTLPPPEVVAVTEPEYVTWSTSGFGIQLSPSPLVFAGTSWTVTATSTVDVGPTPYFIQLYDVDTDTLLNTCGYGTTCEASVQRSTQHVAAFISDSPGSSPLSSIQAQASSNTIVVNPG